MKLKTKIRLTQIATGIFFLFGSIEYAVILPTIYAYISETYHAEPYFLGLCLSAFSLTGLVTAPLFGKWYDKTHKTKLMILFCNLWEIAGNFMYFIGISKYFILLSRLVAGVGNGCISAIFANIAQTTTEGERTAAITVAMAAREVGLLLGPGLNIFLESVDFYLGPWHVNRYTSPGIFMCVMWLAMNIIIIFMYYDLPNLEEQEKILIAEKQIQDGNCREDEKEDLVTTVHDCSMEDSPSRLPFQLSVQSTPPHLPTYLSSSFQEPNVLCESLIPHGKDKQVVNDRVDGQLGTEDQDDSAIVNSYSRECVSDDGQGISDDGQFCYQTTTTTAVSVTTTTTNNSPSRTNKPEMNGPAASLPVEENSEFEKMKAFSDRYGSDIYPGKWTMCKEYFRDQVVVLLTAQFFLSFNQTCLETILTPMTRTYLNFGEFQNSLVFCGAGVEILVVYACVHFLSKRFEDRKLLLVGVLLTLVSISWMLYFVPTAIPEEPGILPLILVAIFFDIAGLPFFAAVVVSLYSKITTERTQGFSQGIRRAIDGIGTILGPLWGSGALHILYVNFGVMEGFLILLLLMIVLSWKRLVSIERYWWLKMEKEEDDGEINECMNRELNPADTEKLLSSNQH
ncbi:uncharacterized protein [Ptychodera flava]|uniref:uncharacterized protein n=1 Tax=Ptychodera flava TaxID=63121 RepID=UPI00396A1C60